MREEGLLSSLLQDTAHPAGLHWRVLPASTRFMDQQPIRPAGEDELIALARKGSRAAFEELVERHKEKAYHIAFDFSRDREEAKDLSQEAFLRAYTKLASFDGRSAFYTWFYRILVNLCLDHRRRAKHLDHEQFEEGIENRMERSAEIRQAGSPDQLAIAAQMTRKISAALDTLPARQRTAFILKNQQGLSIKEIASVMKTAESTVKVHLHRAVTALRASLADLA